MDNIWILWWSMSSVVLWNSLNEKKIVSLILRFNAVVPRVVLFFIIFWFRSNLRMVYCLQWNLFFNLFPFPLVGFDHQTFQPEEDEKMSPFCHSTQRGMWLTLISAGDICKLYVLDSRLERNSMWAFIEKVAFHFHKTQLQTRQDTQFSPDVSCNFPIREIEA